MLVSPVPWRIMRSVAVLRMRTCVHAWVRMRVHVRVHGGWWQTQEWSGAGMAIT